MRKKILVKGPLLSRSGYGEQSRIALRALRSREDIFEIYLMNIAWGNTGHISASENKDRQWIDQCLAQTVAYIQQGGQFDMSLQITIPNEFEKIAPINIGFTAGIETNKIAMEWIEKCNDMVDRIVTISQHSKSVLEGTTYHVRNEQTGEDIPDYRITTPVEAVNYPVYNDEPEPMDVDFTTSKNFLVVSQWGPRKNIENTIKWFVEEFSDDEDVGLILKTNLMKDSIVDREHTSARLKAFLDQMPNNESRKCKIYLVHGELSRGNMTWLYQHPTMKALINIAHGEGYGLPLFEAAYNGLPLVTITWSGQMDFICKTNKKGKRVPLVSRVDYDLRQIQKEAVWNTVVPAESSWAFARESSYKRALREVLTKEKHFKTQATNLKKHILETFTEEAIYAQFVTAVCGEAPKRIDMEQVPRISLITSVYDSAEYIDQLMEDVTSQTIFEEKCEWILLNVNPPGNDAEEEVILKYAEKYPNNIVYKRLKKDPGIYGVWNKAIAMSTGEYITNINCDDRRRVDALEKQAYTLLANPHIDLVYNDSYIAREANVRWKDVNPQNSQRYNFEQFSKEAMLRGNLPHNNPMWRKSLHAEYGKFDEKYRSAGDWEFWLRCTLGGSQFMKHSEILGVYYFNPAGVSTDPKNNSWKVEEEREVFLKYKKQLEQLVPRIVL
tara:strand:- start:6564 stop:8567 length:2004 start_codon:yes stop_codon:yes gene_type:complete